MAKWRTVSGIDVPDIEAFVREASKAGQAVHIGTDSLQTGRYTQFVTVVAVLTPMKGGRAVYTRHIVPRISSMRERLFKEVWLSCELGLKLTECVEGELSIHVDANPNEKHMSSRYLQELVGLVVGQGFKAVIKPDAWTASHVADHVVRYVNSRAVRNSGRVAE